MADQNAPAPAGGGFLGGMLSYAGGMVAGATKAVSSALGYQDLEVTDPNGEAGAGDAGGAQPSEEKVALFTSLKQYIGSDISSLVSVPVWIMEPMTTLQKMAEIMEYIDLLDQAAAAEDPAMRVALVAAFAVSPYAACERVWKPFNPVLGETYEMTCPNGIQLIAEQVSHHPPVGVQHASGAEWEYQLTAAPTTKFLGNSIEIYPNGRTRVKFKKDGELFYVVPPQGKAHNLILGRMWVDQFGTMKIGSPSTGWGCELTFTACGWFGASRYEVSGTVSGPDGVPVLFLFGKWNAHMKAVKCDGEGKPVEGEEEVTLWEANEKPKGDYYGMTHFARGMNQWSDDFPSVPLPTDSRRRKDRAALDAEDSAAAGAAKHEIEERQRADRREREKVSGEWTPKWFKRLEGQEPMPGEPEESLVGFYEFTGDYKPGKRGGEQEAEIVGQGFDPWQYDV